MTTEDELLRRIEDASRYLDVSQLAISPPVRLLLGRGVDTPAMSSGERST